MRKRGRSTIIKGIYGAIAFWGAVALLIGIGWVINIVDLADTSFDPITGLAVLRVIGVFLPPLGAVLGYFV